MTGDKDDQSSTKEAQPTPENPRSEADMIQEISGNLFDAPEGSGLIHACNAQGVWGAGVARAFKDMYPAAFQVYQSHCQKYTDCKETHEIMDLFDENPSHQIVPLPVGTALVIPPQPSDIRRGQKAQWVICLFTSRGFGRKVDSYEQIMNHTSAALQDLKEKLIDLRLDGTEPSPKALFSCRFNSGLFAVPWADTRELLKEAGLRVTVVVPPEVAVRSP